MLDPRIVKEVLSEFRVEDRPSILDAVNLGSSSKVELETWGLFCACLAWGKLEVKRKLLIQFYEGLRCPFTEFVKEPSLQMLKTIFKTRVGALKLHNLCLTIEDILEQHGSIGAFVSKSVSVKEAIFKLASTLRKSLDRFPVGTKYNLPRIRYLPPSTMDEKRKTSALKRYCMYFRWMVRDSEPDFGVWRFFDKRDLWHPLDTHVAKIMKRWRVLNDDSANWLNVEKVTEYFKLVDPDDPLKFDYHLVTFGQKLCKKNDPLCWRCKVKSLFNCNL